MIDEDPLDYDDIPESDPYCAHWISIFDEEHEKDDVRCENCGESCREHLILWGAWCPNAPDGTTDRARYAFKNARWPEGEIEPTQRPWRVDGRR